MFLLQYYFTLEATEKNENGVHPVVRYHTDSVFNTYDDAVSYITNDFHYKTCKLLCYDIKELEVVEDDKSDFCLLHYDCYTYNLLGNRIFEHHNVFFQNFKMALNFVTKVCKNVLRYNIEKVKIKEVE